MTMANHNRNKNNPPNRDNRQQQLIHNVAYWFYLVLFLLSSSFFHCCYLFFFVFVCCLRWLLRCHHRLPIFCCCCQCSWPPAVSFIFFTWSVIHGWLLLLEPLFVCLMVHCLLFSPHLSCLGHGCRRPLLSVNAAADRRADAQSRFWARNHRPKSRVDFERGKAARNLKWGLKFLGLSKFVLMTRYWILNVNASDHKIGPKSRFSARWAF